MNISTAVPLTRSNYVLATGEKASERLRLLNEIFGPGTRELLRLAGLSPGMAVADIGCGTGLVSQWIAGAVAPHGSVTAVDFSNEQLQIGEEKAMAAGLKNVRFQTSDAYQTDLPRESFDLVYSRFLMCHLTEPIKALDEMRRLLKPGGILVCEDHDVGGIFTNPQTRAYKRLVEISETVNGSRGLDSYVGLKLPWLTRQAGFLGPEVRVNQIAMLRGKGKRFWEHTLNEAAPAIQESGASTPDELESICAEMQKIASDESILVMLARVTQVWALK